MPQTSIVRGKRLIQMEALGETISRYSILREIGSGGMGVVYAAFDPKLGRNVAIKLLNPTSDDPMYRMRFEREAKAIAKLKHPNIATLFDFGETADGRPYLVMELVEGRTLTEILLASELTIAKAIDVIVEVAEALAAAHQQGMIHRDIKPSNIMISDAGQVKVLDFGLAKQVGDQADASSSNGGGELAGSKTQTGIVVGTPLYLSPEQAKGHKIDQRSDLFSLGSVLYEALTGRTAFSGQSSLEIGAQVIHVDPIVPSAVNPRVTSELDGITMKALAKDPALRYRSAKALAQALREARTGFDADGVPVARQSAPSAGRTLRTKFFERTQMISRKRVPVGAIVIGVLVLIGGAFVLQRMLRKGPYVPAPKAREFVERGTVLLRNGESHRAGALFQEAVNLDPKYPLAHAKLAEASVDLDAVNIATKELLLANSLAQDSGFLTPSEGLYFKALTASITNNNFGDAVKSYQEIVQQTPNDAKSYLDLGRALEKANQNGAAVMAYRQAIERDPAYPTPYVRLAVLYTRRHEFGSADDALQRAATLFQNLPDSQEGLAQVAEKRGLMFRERGKRDDAQKSFQEALDAARATGNTSLEVNALLGLSSIDISRGRVDEARSSAQQASDLATQHELKPLMVTALIGLSRTQMDRERVAQAEIYLQQARTVAETYDLQSGAQYVAINLAVVRLLQTRPQEALDLALKAKEFFVIKNFRSSVASTLVTILRAQRQLGLYEAALASANERLQIAKEAENPYEIGYTHGEIGSVLVALERFPEALAAYDEFYQIAKNGGFEENAGWAQSNRGEILWRLGRPADADAAFAESERIANTFGDAASTLVAENRRARAEMALSQKRWAEAKNLVAPILAKAKPKADELYIRSQIVSCIADAKAGSPAAAISVCQQAADSAKATNNLALNLSARLALAQSLYLGGKMPDAANLAQNVATDAASCKCYETEWRAWWLAANANRKAGDPAKADSQQAQSNAALNQLEARWGDVVIAEYRSRPDISALN